MKKLFGVLLAAVLLFGMAGQAHAYFFSYDLIRVVYDTAYDADTGEPTGGTYETATTLGNFESNPTFSGISNMIVGSGADAFTTLSGTDYSTLRVAYFINTGTYDVRNVWLSDDSDVATSTTRQYSTFLGNAQGVNTSYRLAEGDANTVQILQSEGNSFWNLFENAAAGSFALYLADGTQYGSQSLADLATVGYVDTYLYYFANGNSAGDGVQVAVIRTMADGSTIINPVPLPAALWLMGTGLIGLFGLRKRFF
jgi:hypothetical protein